MTQTLRGRGFRRRLVITCGWAKYGVEDAGFGAITVPERRLEASREDGEGRHGKYLPFLAVWCSVYTEHSHRIAVYAQYGGI